MISSQEEQDNERAAMNTLTFCIDKARKDGFTNDFTVVQNMLVAAPDEKGYEPAEVKITNFYRFEGESDPGDEAILYLIETIDNIKGIVVNGYGPSANENINRFIKQVEEMHKINPADKYKDL